jgi:metallo-beta-lactamase class B
VAFFVALTSVMAQSQQPAQTKPDSAEAKAHIDAATRAGGSRWAEAVGFFCAADPNRANRPDDPELEPTRLFDNLYVIGRTGTAVYAITTSDGIILIDAGYADQLETLLLPGMAKLGLDPAKVKYVIVTHGHGDHFGGAKYFQDRGARVFVSAADWTLMEQPPAAGRGGTPLPQPKRDGIADESQPISLGDEAVRVAFVPGHTPGSIGVVFPVRDGRSTHTAALFGGTALIPTRIPTEGLQQYVRSVDHFASVTRTMKVDVEIQNHPLYDGISTKLAGLKTRKPGQPHPFVVGAEGYQQFLTVMSECMKAQIARRAG